MRSRPDRPKTGRVAGWQAAFLLLLVVSADTGVEALREHVLRGEATRRLATAPENNADDDLSKAIRAVERAQSVAHAAAQGSIRHNRALSDSGSFADAALNSKALHGSRNTATDPFIAGAIIILTLASMIMKAVTASRKAQMVMMSGKFSEQMTLIIEETNEAVREINDRYDDIFGEVTRQMSDLVRDVGVSAVQLLSNDRVLSAADHAVKRFEDALKPPPATASEEEVSLWQRYKSAPAINKLKDAYEKLKLPLETAKKNAPQLAHMLPDALMSELRAALGKVAAADYAVIHASGDLSSKSKFDKAKLGKYVYLVDPDAMQRVFSLVLSSSSGAPLRAMTEEETKVEALMRRMSNAATVRVLSKGRNGDSSMDAGLMAEQRAANLALRNLKTQGEVEVKEKEVEGPSDALFEINEAYTEVTEMLEQGQDIWKYMVELGGEEAVNAMKANTELVATVVQSMQLVGTVISVVASSMTLYRLDKDKEIAQYEFARASGIAGERHIVAVRRATAATCRLMDSLRQPLKEVINARALDLLKGEQGAPEFWKALGLPLTLKDVTDPKATRDVQTLSDNARKRVSVTIATRFCGVFAPMLTRMEDLFSPAGECVLRLQANAPKPDKGYIAITGSSDVSAQANVRQTSKDVTGKVPSLSGGDFNLPRVETCLDADIYDVQIANDAAIAKALTTLGYTRMADIDASWAPKGDKFLTFEGDLNRHMAEPSAAGTVPGWSHTTQMTTVYILTCKALHDKASDTKVVLDQKIKDFFALLKFPVTDVTFAVRYPDELDDAKSAQAKLQAAGYQMVHFSLGGIPVEDMAFNFGRDIKDRKTASIDFKACKANNVRRGIKEHKAVVTMHILRGGVTPLTDMRLAPFASVSATSGSKIFSSSVGSLADTFFIRNQKAMEALKGPHPPHVQTMATRWYPTKTIAQGTVGTPIAAEKAVSMVTPPSCKDSWDTVTRVDAKWRKQGLFQLLFNREGTETEVTFYKHSFNPRCEVDANAKTLWERVATSPYPDNDRKEAIAQKPYLWVNRRYAIPTFGPLMQDVAACPWECADALKGIVLPPASLYASANTLQQQQRAFAIDADFKVLSQP